MMTVDSILRFLLAPNIISGNMVPILERSQSAIVTTSAVIVPQVPGTGHRYFGKADRINENEDESG
jgi:hypothetical protein